MFNILVIAGIAVLVSGAFVQAAVNVVVDLSHWNGNVNFASAAADGIVGVIHKATQGTGYVDEKYASNRAAAQKAGLLWGAYHFGNNGDGAAQANHFLKTVGNTDGVIMALDIESNPSEGNMTPKQAEDFANTIRSKTGRWPVIYGSTSFLNGYNSAVLHQCPLWVATWGNSPQLPNGWTLWTFWQYTDGQVGPLPHSVAGIGNCDRDQFNGSLERLREIWGKII